MLNVEVGKLRDSEVLEVIREYASYYNEGDFTWHEEHLKGEQDYCPQPCIEVFCYYGKELVKRNASELSEKLKGYSKELFVDHEHFGIEGFSRIMIYVSQDTELYKVVALAKTLSQYGFRKYMQLENLAIEKELREREAEQRIAEYNELDRVAKATASYCKDLESKGVEIDVVQVVTYDCDSSVFWTDVKVVYSDSEFEYFTSNIQRATFEESVKDGKTLIDLLVKYGLSMDKHILDDTETEKF